MRGTQSFTNRGSCQGSPSVANDVFVTYFRTDGEWGGDSVRYKLMCAGNFYFDSFHSVSVAGVGTYGTDGKFYLTVTASRRLLSRLQRTHRRTQTPQCRATAQLALQHIIHISSVLRKVDNAACSVGPRPLNGSSRGGGVKSVTCQHRHYLR